jgi:hypothetical protein
MSLVAERGVTGILEIEATKYPAGAVRRASIRAWANRVETQRINAGDEQGIQRRASHQAEAYNGDIALSHGGSSDPVDNAGILAPVSSE